jgi:hypothetical protein
MITEHHDRREREQFKVERSRFGSYSVLRFEAWNKLAFYQFGVK